VEIPNNAPPVFGPPRMTSPGAVCPATVRKGLANRKSPEVTGNSPATRNTQVRGPEAITQARSDPVPESFVLVTSITTPPRPPTDPAPPPCAPGNDGQFEPLHVTFEDGLDGGGAGAGVGAVTVTVADADLFDCALLVAVTVSVPAFAGAVYSPDELIVPSAAVHVTDVSVPCTDAENCFVPPVLTLAVLGETEIEVTTGADAGAVTVTVAEPDLALSATLVAVTVSAPAFAGAV